MPRCRVVSPDQVRLFLVDVHRRDLIEVTALRVAEKATDDDVARTAALVARAEADGDWVDVRKRLNAGERRAMFGRMYLAGIDGRLRVNPIQQGVAKTVAYLLDWSMVGFDKKKIHIDGLPPEAVLSALDSLDPDTGMEISRAIAWHEEEMEKEKNATAETGVSEPPATSASAA